jgi:hypothetical protein
MVCKGVSQVSTKVRSQYDQAIRAALHNASGIAWDTCHKIYVLMDDEQMEKMAEYGYDPLIKATDSTPEEMFNLLRDWYDNSCGLRFISTVKTVELGSGFYDIIGQEDEEW